MLDPPPLLNTNVYSLMGKITVLRDTQPKKAHTPISAMLLGNVIDWRDLHSSKALSSILLTPSGMEAESSESQPLNALSPILTRWQEC